VAWGFFSPNPGALHQVTKLVQLEKVKPVVQKTFSFTETQKAYKCLDIGHARGKIVIEMA